MRDRTLLPSWVAHGAPDVEARLHRRVEWSLREEIDQLGLASESCERLLLPYVRTVILEVVTSTLLRLEGRAPGDDARHVGAKPQRVGGAPQ